MPALQDAQAPVEFGKALIDLRLVLTRDELLHRIQRGRRHTQVADKLIIRTRPQLLQIPVRLNPLAPRNPALFNQQLTSRRIQIRPSLYLLNVLPNLRHVAVGRPDI